MDRLAKQKLRVYIADILASQGDLRKFDDDESLFLSFRLDFIAMMHLAAYLEQSYGINFLENQLDISLLDSVAEIELLIDSQPRICVRNQVCS